MAAENGLPKTGASRADLDAAEARLGVRFPEDYAVFLLSENGRKEWFQRSGKAVPLYLELYSVADVVDLTEVHEHQASHPGLCLYRLGWGL